MINPVRVAIIDDHQSIIDGYIYRLSQAPGIQVVGSAATADGFFTLLENQPVDVLLLDIYLPTSPANHNPFPVLHILPGLLQKHPLMKVLVISMLTQQTLVNALVEAGVKGYIFKDDQASIQQLAAIVARVANGETYFSPEAQERLNEKPTQPRPPTLTTRQLEVLSMCAAYPDSSSKVLARQLGVASSTLRNLLSRAYFRLGVRTRAAAIAKASQLGLIPAAPDLPGADGVEETIPSREE